MQKKDQPVSVGDCARHRYKSEKSEKSDKSEVRQVRQVVGPAATSVTNDYRARLRWR